MKRRLQKSVYLTVIFHITPFIIPLRSRAWSAHIACGMSKTPFTRLMAYMLLLILVTKLQSYTLGIR